MDGVLVMSQGYHRALQQTVAWMAEALGYRDAELVPDDIALIESLGISSEWESAAICTALLLAHGWRHGLDIEPPERLPNPRPPHGVEPPPLRSFFEQLGPLKDSRSALAELESGLASLDGQAADPELLRELLQTARSPESLTHRTIQALVLGPTAYRETYGDDPDLESDSYLTQYDEPALSPETRADLRSWLGREGHTAAIFTNRPSMPPSGHIDPPEAQIGAELVGLPELPIVGSGDLGWLALREDQPLYHYLKPSPVHALAALQRAIDVPQEPALLRALELHRGSDDRAHWKPLSGAVVRAFEDSAKGLISVERARERLAQVDVHIEIELIGISPHPDKRTELKKTGAQVFDSLEQAISTQARA
ncbi:MAG: hypothetical protein R3191_02370 [Anaerolineales bacterium]|nr:hypothetical protein [Anaerolineales bacterium]